MTRPLHYAEEVASGAAIQGTSVFFGSKMQVRSLWRRVHQRIADWTATIYDGDSEPSKRMVLGSEVRSRSWHLLGYPHPGRHNQLPPPLTSFGTVSCQKTLSMEGQCLEICLDLKIPIGSSLNY